ncbi:plasmid stability protein [Bradyrhizobium elkanii]|uniref:NUMOD3 domain-containing DNA-binding protein n=1 Tax=Bradyrhizobium elkanii TaxID=29448 RepID=UPI00216818B8|nr:NUMOD3 domain-containing DNA-binding protein [Bradyrhizobium elkanii]MCS3692000.1 plasmid stability protein [Bradyrhizobium elkanii]
MIKDRTYFVYWLRDESCVDIATDGYVGVSWNPQERFKAHKRTKRFPDNCRMEIVFTGSQPECLQEEIRLRPVAGIGWNLAMGGPNGYRHGHSEASRAKMSSARKGRDTVTPEGRAKIRAALTGRTVSAETRAKQRAARLGKPQTAAQKAALLKANTGNSYLAGHTHTQEARGKISAALIGNQFRKGVPHTPETKAKIGAFSIGKPRSAETREKIRAGLLARRKQPEGPPPP